MKLLETASQVLTVIVAVSALIFSVVNENRNAKRFQTQIDQSDRIAKAQVRPILSVLRLGYKNMKGIKLINSGAGPAIIHVKSDIFCKNKKYSYNITELMQFEHNFSWNDYFTVGENTFLKAGEEINLCLLTEGHLINQGISKNKAEKILQDFDEHKKGINIRIEYEDVLGNPQPVLIDSL